jgi:hypothetical protein
MPPIFPAYMREKLRDTDEDVRLRVINLLGEIVHPKNQQFGQIMYDSALLLKDEVSEIREAVGDLLSIQLPGYTDSVY